MTEQERPTDYTAGLIAGSNEGYDAALRQFAPMVASLRTMLGYGEAWAAAVALKFGEDALEVQGMRRQLAAARAALAGYDKAKD